MADSNTLFQDSHVVNGSAQYIGGVGFVANGFWGDPSATATFVARNSVFADCSCEYACGGLFN